MSFEAEFERSLPALRAFSRRLVREREDAEDLVQDVVMLALRSRSQFDGANMKAWLFIIMRNRAINSSRRQAYHKRSEGLVATSSCGVWASARPLPPDAGIDGEGVRAAMSSLSPDHRSILSSLGDGMSYEEMARSIGRPIGTVMSRVHRARASFTEAYR